MLEELWHLVHLPLIASYCSLWLTVVSTINAQTAEYLLRQ